MRFPLQTIMDPFSILDTDAADNTEPSTPRPMQTSHHDEQAPRSSPASTLEFHDVRGDPPTPKEQKTAAPEPSSPTVGGMPPLPVRVRSTPAVRGNESLDELLAPTADASSPTGASPPPPLSGSGSYRRTAWRCWRRRCAIGSRASEAIARWALRRLQAHRARVRR